MSSKRNAPYRSGELEVILSLVPTKNNIRYLSELLERSTDAIEIVYRIAYEYGLFGKHADVQERKVIQAKNKVGIVIGRKKPRNTSA